MTKQQFTYLNRDLSWLSFNERVLMEAADSTVPLYSRLQFLSIYSSNLDEFFRVRMPSIYAFSGLHHKKLSLEEEYPGGLVLEVKNMVQSQLKEFGRILGQGILPALRQQGMHLCYGETIDAAHQDFLREYFLSRVLSFLQPVLLHEENGDKAFLENNALYLVAACTPQHNPGITEYLLLNIPSSSLPRFLALPETGNMHQFVFLDDVIRENLATVFPGYSVTNAWSIKLTRNADLNIDDEFSGDIAEKIEKQLSKRDTGAATRLLYDGSMPEHVAIFLRGYLGIGEDEMAPGGRYHNLKDLSGLPNPKAPQLSYRGWPPVPHPGFHNNDSIFRSIADSDKLLHLPYQSYNYILRFFNEAAIDPLVTDIYVTLYRVAANSHITNALMSAARNGKKVVVFVELKARFDEANNLRWSKKMKEAGVKIINSIPGLKVHAKIALVKRKNQQATQSFSLMATGNFNESTARFYTDHVLMTSKPSFSSELEQLFAYLQSRLQPAEYGKIKFHTLLVSQFNMIKRFRKLIRREIDNARAGLPAQIIVKLNNLEERAMIAALYEASRAGVKVDLIVRSICCVAPGIPGQSENIRVLRIVDRYLEHARVFIFHNNGEPEIFMGSADWMNRNLHNRIEVIFPVGEEALKQEIVRIIDLQLGDRVKAVRLGADLVNEKMGSLPDLPAYAAQEAVYTYMLEMNGKGR